MKNPLRTLKSSLHPLRTFNPHPPDYMTQIIGKIIFFLNFFCGVMYLRDMYIHPHNKTKSQTDLTKGWGVESGMHRNISRLPSVGFLLQNLFCSIQAIQARLLRCTNRITNRMDKKTSTGQAHIPIFGYIVSLWDIFPKMGQIPKYGHNSVMAVNALLV